MMMSNKGQSMVLMGLVVLAVAGCSGSKVTTKTSSELPRYQIRTIALVPFTTPRDATGEGGRRSNLLSAAGGSQV